ncbi:MAG: ribosomal protein S18-alanine N-acetyltransferase [Bacteroides sp.]|nr:ribosomal protein S18-alanine N-acetyltransferase [Bacillota bacterium]MCM1393443.1 ribosomal protein S18-alanine N-acetyltransferase [[Eubacterium] siraeum]MCM1455057.1 ribosomal protein S18-alanine N-acetyltransferase [Bacteroides sp.]
MTFERLKSEHLPQMAEIEKEAFDEPWTVGMFLPELEDPNAYYMVGVLDGEVICYGGFHKVLDEGQIANIAVRSDMRGQGLGRLLMQNLLELAKREGVKRITLEVKDTNERAVNLYKSLGFTVEGVRKRYYAYRYDALVMWLTIGED